MNDRDTTQLIAELRTHLRDPARQSLAVALATDLVRVQAMDPESVRREMPHLLAQAKSLEATEVRVVNDALERWASSAASILLTALIGRVT